MRVEDIGNGLTMVAISVPPPKSPKDLNLLMWAVAVGMEKSGFYRENTEAALLDKVVNKKGEFLCLGGKLECLW